MGGLSFLTPLFLAGAATAAIPILIHLIFKRRTRTVVFSTLMFLRLSHARVAKRRRLHEWLLLLLRCALLLLLAAAFAGPVWRSAGVEGAAAVHAVFVVDDSYSMTCRVNGTTPFQQAQEAVAQATRALPAGSAGALLFASRRNAVRQKETLTPNLLEIERGAAAAEPSSEACTLAPAFARACEILGASEGLNRELYVLSDLQRHAWSGEGGAEEALDGVEVVIVDCGATPPEQAAVTGLSVTCDRADRLGQVDATVSSYAQAPRTVELTLRSGVDAPELKDRAAAELAPGGHARVRLRQTLAEQALWAGGVEIDGDPLPVDNARFFALAGQGGLRVLLAAEGAGLDKGRAAPGADGFYLRSALTAGGAFDVFAVAPETLPAMDAAGYDAIVLGQVTRPSPALAAMLGVFLERGGGVLMCVGPAMDVRAYNGVLGTPRADGRAVLAAGLDEVVSTPAESRESWAEIDVEHPIFAPFSGMIEELQFVRAQRYVRLAAEGAGDAWRVLARYGNGDPAVVESQVGAGRLLLLTTSCDGAWSNLVLRASFVPLLHEAVRYLAGAQADAEDDRFVGAPLRIVFPAASGTVDLIITDPAGRRHSLQSRLVEGTNSAVFTDTFEPGHYRIECGGAPASVPPVTAYNVDTRESDLSRLSLAQASRRFGGAAVHTTADPDTLGRAMVRRREGMKLWGPLLAALVAVALLESLLASAFSPKKAVQGVRARSCDLGSGAAPARVEGER